MAFAKVDDDDELSVGLLEYMENSGFFDTEETARKRQESLWDMETLIMEWTNIVAETMTDGTPYCDGQLRPVGSYRFGVQAKSSDIDLVYIAPPEITDRLFFDSFYDYLKRQEDVSDLRVSKTNEYSIRLIRLRLGNMDFDIKFAGVSSDDGFDEVVRKGDFTEALEHTKKEAWSLSSMNECLVATAIEKSVPDRRNFQMSLRAIKLWAHSCGVYGQAMGFFGGILLTVMMARICQDFPHETPAGLVEKFFHVYRRWNWHADAVILDEEGNNFVLSNGVAGRTPMTVLKPGKNIDNAAHRVRQSSLRLIELELEKACKACEKIAQNNGTWKDLFAQPDEFFQRFEEFLVLKMSIPTPEETKLIARQTRIVIGREVIPDLEREAAVELFALRTREYSINEGEQLCWVIGLIQSENARQGWETQLLQEEVLAELRGTMSAFILPKMDLLQLLPRQEWKILGLDEEVVFKDVWVETQFSTEEWWLKKQFQTFVIFLMHGKYFLPLLWKSHSKLKKKYKAYQKFLEEIGFESNFTSLSQMLERDDDPIQYLTFKKLKPLGRGTQGKVYKVRCNEVNYDYAMKCIPLHEAERESAKLLREVAEVQKLNHPNIVTYICHFEAEVDLFKEVHIIMELCDCDLEERLAEKRMTPDEIIDFIRQMARAVAFLHEKHVLHRDIKPKNILVQGASYKLGDFESLKGDYEKTTVMTITGSMPYLAPEIKFGEPIQGKRKSGMAYNNKVDDWSIGMVILECWFGKTPESGSMTKQKLELKIKEETGQITDRIIKNVVSRLVKVDPKDREHLHTVAQRFLLELEKRDEIA